MHGLFCYNVSLSDAPAYEQRFRVYTAPEDLTGALTAEAKALARAEGKHGLPEALGSVKWFLLAGGFAAFLRVWRGGVSFSEGYRSSPFVFWIGCVLVAAAGAFALADVLLPRLRRGGEAAENARRRYEAAERKVRENAGVPIDAEKAEILIVCYRGDEKHQQVMGAADNTPLDVFMRDGDLCIFDGIDVFAFPRSGMTGLRIVEREFPISGWNKPQPPTQKQYIDCGVTLHGEKPASLRFCCALDLSRDGEDYRLLFPAYELPVFARLTGLAAPELPERAR